MTKANIYRLVKAKTAHAWKMHELHERDGNERQSEHYVGEWMGLNSIRVALESQENFDFFCEMFLEEPNEPNKPH